MPTIAEALRDEMIDRGSVHVWAGDPDLCLMAYERAGLGADNRRHPLNRIKSVIDAARRSDLFSQHGYIRAGDATGSREILHPSFVLKVSSPE